MKIYTDESHIRGRSFGNLVHILTPFWNRLSEEERHKKYQSYYDCVQLVENPQDVDVFVLPFFYEYYRKNDLRHLVDQFVRSAKKWQKKLVVWDVGDLVYELPYENTFLFHPGLDRKYRKDHQFARIEPVEYILDYYPNGIPYHSKPEKPVIGFCGQAAITPKTTARFGAHNLLSNVQHLLTSNPIPPPLMPHTFLRSRILKSLSRSKQVETRFIIRDKYRLGIKEAFNKNPRTHVTDQQVQVAQRARREFIDNLNESDYVVCVRGAGNWSVRFAETLAHGRIPIFFDTDCVLPFDFLIDWKQYCVWIDRTEIPFAAEKVADFHAGLSSSRFTELQHACYELWNERLTRDGFVNHFYEHFSQMTDCK